MESDSARRQRLFRQAKGHWWDTAVVLGLPLLLFLEFGVHQLSNTTGIAPWNSAVMSVLGLQVSSIGMLLRRQSALARLAADLLGENPTTGEA